MGDSVKLFVYGVSSSCPKRILEEEFRRHGRVSDVFITGKGYAFITMESKDEAEDAIDALNGKKIDGQDVKVEMAVSENTYSNLTSDLQLYLYKTAYFNITSLYI